MFIPQPETIEQLNGYYSQILETFYPVEKMGPAVQQATENAKMFVDAPELWAEIRGKVQSSEYFLLVVDGEPGSGKTSIARELGHETHKEGYAVVYSSSFDILKAPITFKQQAGGADYVTLILDDISYLLASQANKVQNMIKNFFSQIRHAMKAHIFLIVVSHFVTAVPPLFKNSNVWIFSAPTTQESDMMVKIIGRKQELRKQLQNTFDFVKDIQQLAGTSKDLVLTGHNTEYKFRWGDKEDPGDGRIMLLLKNGESFLYNAKKTDCQLCSLIGANITVDGDRYVEQEQGHTPPAAKA